MSDLESVGRARDAIITEVAGGKIRSFARSGGLGSDEGLLDAFAEIFARMSEAKVTAPTAEQNSSSEDLGNPSSDSLRESETDSENDGSHKQCVAARPDGLSMEDVEVPTASVVAIAALEDAAPQPVENIATLAVTELDLTVPVVANVLDAETGNSEIADDQVRQGLSGDDGEVFFVRRREASPTSDSKSAGVNPLRGEREGAVMTAGRSDPEIVSSETGEEVEQPLQQFGGEATRNRRVRHRGGRHAEQLQAPASQNGSRETASTVESLKSPVDPEASGGIENATRVRSAQGSTAAAAVNRSAQAAVAASAIATNSGSNTTRFGPTVGNGIREVVPNPSMGATVKTIGRPASEARGKTVDTTHTLARVKLIQRVSKAFQHLGPEGGIIRLRLAPAEMGSVRVEMRIQQRKVAARVVAETEAASAALREHLPELRARLESLGMQVEQLDIETDKLDPDGDSNFEDPTSRDKGWQEPDRRQQHKRARQFQTNDAVDVSQHVSPVATTTSASAGIDVHL